MVDFFIFVGASRVCSSHSNHGVFLSGFGRRSSRLSWVVWALPRLYRFSPGFSLINWTILFFLINRKGKTFISFQKKTPILVRLGWESLACFHAASVKMRAWKSKRILDSSFWRMCPFVIVGVTTNLYTNVIDWYVSNVSIIFDAPCLFMHHLLCVLFTLRGVFMHFPELTY
jgi:hypothetical protein